LPGALSLVLDLLENERKFNIQFDHIFIEAGTGFTASALLLGLDWIEHPAHIHIILLADKEEKFLMRLNLCQEMFTQLLQTDSSLPNNFTLHYPLLTKGFGQIKASLFETILYLARNEGFLTDPIYSAKLFIESKRIITQENIKGNVMLLHSGGSFTLMGFQQQIHNILS
jgi:1-aminocyclopropane-1-carboxylate deaminase/D-cysteine desulfhydrase-like pyridoxal-dependent ACC family enzyme